MRFTKALEALALVVFFLAVSPADCAISFVRVATGSATSGSTVTVTISSTANDTLIAGISVTPQTATVSSITDTAGNTWTNVNAINAASTVRTEEWRSPLHASTVTSVTFNLSGSATSAAVFVAEYSGAAAFGANATATGHSGTAVTISLTTQDNNNFVVAATGDNETATDTALTGNLRATRLASNTVASVVDSTSSTPASVTCAVTQNTSGRQWAAVALELRTVGSSGCTEQIALQGAGCR